MPTPKGISQVPTTSSPTTVPDILYHPTLLAKAEATILQLISAEGEVSEEQIRVRLFKNCPLVTSQNLGIIQALAMASLIERGKILPMPLPKTLAHQGFTWVLAK